MSFLPSSHRDYLAEKAIVFDEIEAENQRAVVFREYHLPVRKFDIDRADALIFIPPGYPDIPPDMFYLHPWAKLIQGNRYPSRADVAQSFCGRTWQRWSRHSSEWRPGVDGIWTMLKRMDTALRAAA